MLDIKKVLVTVPTRGNPRAETVMGLQEIRDAAPGLPPILYLSTRLSVCDGRNQVVKKFLSSDAEFLIMLDDDIIPHPDLLKLAELDLDIVAAPVLIVRTQQPVPFPNAFTYNQKTEDFSPLKDAFGHCDRGDLVECGGVGTGVICMARRVLEHPSMVAPFRHRWTSDGVMSMTEDLTFCIRARSVGFKVWCDFSKLSDQLVTTNITGLAQRYGSALEAVSPQRNSGLVMV